MQQSSRVLAVLACTSFLVVAPMLQAQPANAQSEIEEVVIWGRSLQQLGRASAASQGVVGYDDFSTRPFGRVGELVEVVPGMIATQHSGMAHNLALTGTPTHA